MVTDIFPFPGWVQDSDGMWARCAHPLNARQAAGGSFEQACVVCLACGVFDAIAFHNRTGLARPPERLRLRNE